MTNLSLDPTDISSYFVTCNEPKESVLDQGVGMFGGPQLGPDVWGKLPVAATSKVTCDKLLEATKHEVAVHESCNHDNSTTNPASHEIKPYNEKDFEQNGGVDFNGSLAGGLDQAILDEIGDSSGYTMQDLMNYTDSVGPEPMIIDTTNTTTTGTTIPPTTASMTPDTTKTLIATFADDHPLMAKFVFGIDNSTTTLNAEHLAKSSYPPYVIHTNSPKTSPIFVSTKAVHPGTLKTSNAGFIIAKTNAKLVKSIPEKKIVGGGTFDETMLLPTGMKIDEQRRLVDIWPKKQPKTKTWYDPDELFYDITISNNRLLSDSEKASLQRIILRRKTNCVTASEARTKKQNAMESLSEENTSLKAAKKVQDEENAKLKEENLFLREAAKRFLVNPQGL